MAPSENHDSDGSSHIQLSNIERSSRSSSTSRSSSESRQDPETSAATLIRHRSSSSVPNLPEDDGQNDPNKISEPVSTILPDDQASSDKPRRRKAQLGDYRDIWIKEMASMALSIGCMIAVFAILVSQKDKPLPSWPLYWQPNSVVSFLTTISRAALIFPLASCISQFKWHHFQRTPRQLVDLQRFDAASRGPLGSLTFIFGVTFQSRSIVASLACVLTIAALSMETFVQQTIEYPVKLAPVKEKLCTAKTSQFYGIGNSSENGANLRANMGKAIYTGIFGQTSFETLTCPTGNCTWPDLATIGVCNSCENITLTTEKHCYSGASPENDTYSDGCKYKTPSGVELSGSNGGSSRINMSTILTAATTDTNNSYAYLNATILKNPLQIKTNYTTPTGPLEIYDCSIQLCSKVFSKASVSPGSSWPGDIIKSSPLTSSKDDMEPVGYMDGKKYTVEKSQAFNFVITLLVLFKSDLLRIQNIVDDGSTTQEMNYLSYIYNSDNIPKLLDDMALSMTQYMRTINPVEVPGESLEMVAFVHVNWLWFIPPVLLELSAVILLAASILISNREKRMAGTQVWKDSVFPYLFNGIDKDRLNEVGPGTTDSASEMEKRAQQISVQLERDNGDGRDGKLRFI